MGRNISEPDFKYVTDLLTSYSKLKCLFIICFITSNNYKMEMMMLLVLVVLVVVVNHLQLGFIVPEIFVDHWCCEHAHDKMLSFLCVYIFVDIPVVLRLVVVWFT